MLSKTDLLSYLQCPRQLWLAKHKPDEATRNDVTLERRTMDGHLVNERARSALGPGFIWPASQNTPQESMAKALEALAASPDTPVVEMPLVRDELYCRLDALVPVDGGYAIQETKASTFPLKSDKVTPAKPEEHFVDDLTIQAWVAEATELPLVEFSLNLLNSRWIYQGEDDYDGLFRLQNVTQAVHERKALVPIWLQEAKDVVEGPMPEATTGGQCKKPHECPFIEHCKAMEPAEEKHPVELLPDLAGKNLAKTLRSEGYKSLLDVPRELLQGTHRRLYQRIQTAHQTGEAQLSPEVRDILKNMPYPRYYFDFEGIDLPVPRWDGVRPYEQIPFQWSCHIEHEPGVFTHKAFLDISGDDPSLGCIQRMREVINEHDNGPILVYYQTYEKGRLQELALRHPQHKDLMDLYISRLVDLFPLVKEHYYHPDMKGSFSIKKVLPTVAPDLRYEDLEDIQEGTAAQVGYLHAAFEPLSKKQRERLTKNALAYCEQDTWAMVLVSYFLEGRTRVDMPASDMSPMEQLKRLTPAEIAKRRAEQKRREELEAQFEDISF